MLYSHSSNTRPPIFIVGTGRSGTSLLRLMLCAHPRIHITFESAIYFWDELFPRQRNGSEFLEYYFQTFSFRWLRLDPAEVTRDLPRPLPRSQIHLAFSAIMRAMAVRYGGVRFGDKTPMHSGALSRLYEDFPDAKVIHIVRDPRRTVESLCRMPFTTGSICANSIILEVERRQIGPFRARMLDLRLEDLLADPRSTMARVLEWVGEPWSPAVLDHASHVPDPPDWPPMPWFGSAAQPLKATAMSGQALDPAATRLIEGLTKECMKTWGYERSVLPREPSWLSQLDLLCRDLPEAMYSAFQALRLGRRIRNASAIYSDLTRAIFCRLNRRAWELYPGFTMPEPPALPRDWRQALRGESMQPDGGKSEVDLAE